MNKWDKTKKGQTKMKMMEEKKLYRIIIAFKCFLSFWIYNKSCSRQFKIIKRKYKKQKESSKPTSVYFELFWSNKNALSS